MARSRIIGGVNINVLLAFVFGVVFLSVILGLVIFVKDLSEMARWVIVIIMALAGAGFAAVIPGVLNVELPYIKSGGALAVLVLVIINQPKIVKTAIDIVATQKDTTSVLSEYLKNIDDGHLDKAWESLDQYAKITSAADKNLFKSAYENGRYIHGEVIERTPPLGSDMIIDPPGYPAGIYRVISFRTKFSDGCRQESVSVRSDEDKNWHVFGHNVSISPIPCTGPIIPSPISTGVTPNKR
ncbi:DUF4019 domain-containing protein [Serratia sp. OS31]|uniref:DUF4019 domain-containing protein n=1 Tax=Serratia sp. OS31 TaxID=2760844 RepID=UPI001600FBF1|nr:DUF4019 domain-containing protein [Serratia sp. OS31]MBB1583462.1 DUF4019 domain-containing protein [Serratia sp. OS31]